MGRALGLWVKAADAFQRIAEQVEAHGLWQFRREQINYPAPYRKVTPFANRRGANIAVSGKIGLNDANIENLTGPGRERRCA